MHGKMPTANTRCLILILYLHLHLIDRYRRPRDENERRGTGQTTQKSPPMIPLAQKVPKSKTEKSRVKMRRENGHTPHGHATRISGIEVVENRGLIPHHPHLHPCRFPVTSCSISTVGCPVDGPGKRSWYHS